MSRSIVTWILLAVSVTAARSQTPVDNVIRFYNQNKRDSALMLVEEHLPRYQKEEKWDSLVQMQRLKGTVYSAVRSFQEALEEFDKAEEMADRYLEPTDYVYLMTILRKGDLLNQMFRQDEAMGYFSRVIELAGEAGDETGLKAKALEQRAWIYFTRKQYRQAIADAYESIRENMALAEPDSFTMVGNYKILGVSYEHLAILDSALHYKEKSLHLMQQLFPPDHVNVGISYLDMMGYYYETSEMDKALENILKAENIFHKNYLETGLSRYLAVAVRNTGLLYNQLGEWRLAREYTLKSTEWKINEYGENNPYLVEDYCSLAELDMTLGNFTQARELLEKAEAAMQRNPSTDQEMIHYIKSYQSKLFMLEGHSEQARQLAEEVYRFYMQKGELYSKRGFNAIQRLMDIDSRDGRHTKALEWSMRNLEIVDSIFPFNSATALPPLNFTMGIYMEINNDQGVEATAANILARMHNGTGHPSIRNCLPAAELLNFASLWARYLEKRWASDTLYRQIYLDFIEDFEVYYNQHLSIIRSNSTISDNALILKQIYWPGLERSVQDNPELALLFAEKIKAFLTRVILQNQLIKTNQYGRALQNEINQLLARSVEDTSVTVFLQAGNLMEQHNRYKDSLYHSDPVTYTRVFGFPQISLEDLRAGLYPGETMIEYIVGDSVIYVICYNAGREISVHELSRPDVDSLLNDDGIYEDPGILRKLYEILLPEPVRNDSDYFIIPDGNLFYFNFEQLIDENGNYLLSSKNIRYAYSAAVHRYQQQLGKIEQKNRNILALTPGFSSSLKEYYLNRTESGMIDSTWLYFIQQPFLIKLAESLHRIYDSESYTGADANEQSFKTGYRGFKIIHLGTHGIIDDASPLFSRLIFAKDSIEDGYLHTYEIYAQELNADLAVLSACETGTGVYASGEGVLSLAHAFTHAGCPSVLMSLWKVDEKSSAQILERFYHYLQKGERKSVALRNAKLDYLEQVPSELRNSYFWAGFVIMGDDSPIRFARGHERSYWLLGVLLLAGAWIFWKKRNQKAG